MVPAAAIRAMMRMICRGLSKEESWFLAISFLF